MIRIDTNYIAWLAEEAGDAARFDCINERFCMESRQSCIVEMTIVHGQIDNSARF